MVGHNYKDIEINQRKMSVKKIKGFKIFMDEKLGKGAYGSVLIFLYIGL